MEMSKEKIADQLNKRHRERQDHLTAKHELSKQNDAAHENLEYFHMSFKRQLALIEEKLNNLTPNTDKVKLTQSIHKILEDIQNSQTLLTSSTLFLPDYTVKTYQASINDLKARLDTTKDKLISKKKFNFQKRTTVTAPKSVTTVDSGKSEPKISTDIEDTSHIDWTIQNRSGEEILLCGDEVNNKDITISRLNGCLIKITGHPSSLQVSRLVNCVILCGPISRSLMADHCMNCKFVFGCQQLRLHNSQHCDLYMHVTCRAIIEDCQNINVAPYNYTYDNMNDDFTKAGLDTTKNNWEDIADFNWLSADAKSPNWNQIPDQLRITNWSEFLKGFP